MNVYKFVPYILMQLVGVLFLTNLTKWPTQHFKRELFSMGGGSGNIHTGFNSPIFILFVDWLFFRKDFNI
jgi:hypothetical protein